LDLRIRNRSKQDRPAIACEVLNDRVVAARASEAANGLETFTTRELPEGSVAPDLTEANILRAEALRQAIADVLQTIAGRSRDVIAILPDATSRVVLLDFESLPEKREEAEAVVRFRLKKSLPFDVEKARVSYQAQPTTEAIKVVAAVALNSVVDEYESAFRDAGYSPGVVLPSMLATLGAVEATRPTMVVKVDPQTISIALLDRSQLLLFRTLENTRGLRISGDQLAEDVYPSLVFFQDTYKLNIERVYLAGLEDTEAALRSLQTQTNIEVEELVSSSHINGHNGNQHRARLAGVLGALMS
jgi:type IV pilus assembly protein PilM